MNIQQFLGNLGPVLSGQPIGPRPMPGAPSMPSGMDASPVDQLLGPVNVQQAAPQPRPQVESQPKKRGGVRDLLGKLGDALLVGAGGEPIYSKRLEREQLGEDLAAYLGVDDPRLAALVREHPETFATMFNAQREDKRFDRTAGQDDARIGIAGGQLDLGRDELKERVRSNRAGEGITARGQDISAGTQVQLQRMRDRQAGLERQFNEAVKAQDFERQKILLQLGHQNALEIKALEGGDGAGYEETTVETPGTEARDGWFSDTPATPSSKTVTRRPIARTPQVSGEAQYKALPRGATFVGPDGKTYRKP